MKYFFIFSLIILSFSSCHKRSSKQVVGDLPILSCDSNSKKLFVYSVMHDSYLWASKTPIMSQEKIVSYKSDEELLDALRYKKDKFSFIMDKKEHDDYFDSGVVKGFGYFPSLVKDDNGSIVVHVDFVYPSSPASKVGLKRGDMIESFDGYRYEDIESNKTLYKKYFFSSDDNISVKLHLVDGRDISIDKEEFDIKTVLDSEILNIDGLKVGYLVYQSFIASSKEELDKAFLKFKQEHIDELILDLRYNGGGFVYLAKYLATLIGGDRVKGTVFNIYKYNKKYSNYDSIDYFDIDAKNELSLKRVFIISTRATCSASELVINSLRSSTNSVKVIGIGDSTCGKPYAMSSIAYCDRYILPIQMESQNGDGVGGYIDGIAPLCKSYDGINRDFGDLDEDSLSSAIYFIKNGRCKEKYSLDFKRYKKENFVSGFRGYYGIF